MNSFSVWNLKFWVADPSTGLASVRKIAGYACVLILLAVTWGAIFKAMPLSGLIALLSAGTAGCGIYAVATPSKDATPPEVQSVP